MCEEFLRTQLRPHVFLRLLTPALGWWMHCPRAWLGWAWPGLSDPPPDTSPVRDQRPRPDMHALPRRRPPPASGPAGPLVAGVRLSVTALSYDGQFVVSLLGDDKCPICRFSPWAYAPHSRITFKPASRLPED